MDPTAGLGAARALWLTRMLRAAILLACLGAASAAWVLGSPTIAALALVVALEETWETSIVVAALRRQVAGTPVPRRRAART